MKVEYTGKDKITLFGKQRHQGDIFEIEDDEMNLFLGHKLGRYLKKVKVEQVKKKKKGKVKKEVNE